MAEINDNLNCSVKKRAAIHTLGCRLNHAESRVLEERLRAAGYEIVPFHKPADLGIIHTCVVTRQAEAKSRKYIHRFLSKNPNAIVAVIGCYAQTAAQTIAAIGEVDIILGNDAKMQLPQYLELLPDNTPLIVRPRPKRKAFTLNFEAKGPPLKERVNLKIQDGCDAMCSYCYIPFARGRSRSRDFNNIVDEALSIVERGAKEIVLTGVNLGDYECGEQGLLELVDRLSDVNPQPRLRISSIELSNLPEALFTRMADPDHALVPHLHIPLQSGSKNVLEAMGRNYSPEDYLALLNRAVTAVPGIGIGADVMVGFPGESPADFEATYRLIEESPIFYLHVFQYSERPEVASARLPNKVPESSARSRSQALIQLHEQKKKVFQEQWVGQRLRVLFENRDHNGWKGHADNYLEVFVKDKKMMVNQLEWIRIHSLEGTRLIGSPDT
ncbi:MAG: tRNA (N(6)-L-threonylcarbamoyladenosine(37)-C(2))-methylthiotransferase MtaB [Candidatus Hydrogenedentes bacterium]|jgi:threonylcarbamoyladenosine tRNA methylthiotransferase MtaB|nr:tRNA (N(6)-L-threonylcarbamoyladenosine(37)-C(2))-methylthiotransferase MtaB [Candidatus Hydrogenedentota bacterium]